MDAEQNAYAAKEAELINRLNALANAAASSILEGRDHAKREMAVADSAAMKTIAMLKDEAKRCQPAREDMTMLMASVAKIRGELAELNEQIGNLRGVAKEINRLVGRTVRLHSDDSRVMTAAAFDGTGIVCMWFNGGELMEQTIPISALVAVK